MGTMLMQDELGTLESGLKGLKRCRLMGIQEFQDMYSAIEQHHRDLKLAHLTGKERDLMERAERDTKFYHVLVKMLNEVKILRSAKQRESLLKVYSWYMANRHTLSSRPRFGKSFQKEEADNYKKKIVKTPRTSRSKTSGKEKHQTDSPKPIRLMSADGMQKFFKCETPSSRMGGETPSKGIPVITELPSNKDYVSDYLANRFFGGSISPTARTGSDAIPIPHGSLARSGSSIPDADTIGESYKNVGSEHLGLDLRGITSGGNSPREPDIASNVSQHYIESLINESHKEDYSDVGSLDAVNSDVEEMDFSESRRKLSRGQTPSASIRPSMNDQSSNGSIAMMPKKMIHPIASLVNPHAQLAAQEADKAEQEYWSTLENNSSLRALSGKTRSSLGTGGTQTGSEAVTPVFRPTTSMSTSTKPESIQGFKNFTKDWTYGQDILSKLTFVGRSGTAMDVRYTAHQSGEMPENETPQVLAFYAAGEEGNKKVIGPVPVKHKSSITQTPLEDFYQLTDGYYPAKLPKYRPVSGNKSKTSTPRKQSETPDSSKKCESKAVSHRVKPLGRQLLSQHVNGETEETPTESEIKSSVKMEQVYGLIDDVTEDMNFFKEKLAPTPQPGYRQPSCTSVSMRPLSRPNTASGVRSHTAPPPETRSPAPPFSARESSSYTVGFRSPSPNQRSNTPIQHANTDTPSRSFSSLNNPFASRDIQIPSPDAPDTLTSRSTVSHPVNKVIQSTDWTGKTQPDSVRYMWQATKFGGHTYTKKLITKKRPVGATHGGSRPTTAPANVKDRWNTTKPSDMNTRIEAQAATNNMMNVDQSAMDSLLMVQHIMGTSDSKGGSFNSLIIDEAFLRSFHARHHTGSTATNTPPSREYLSFVSTPPGDNRAGSQLAQAFGQNPTDNIQHFPEGPLVFSETSTPREVANQLPASIEKEEGNLATDHVSLHLPAAGVGSSHHSPPSTKPVEESIVPSEAGEKATEGETEVAQEAVTDQGHNNQEDDDTPTQVSQPQKVDRPISAITEESSVDSDLTEVIERGVKKPIQFYSEDDGDVHIQVTAIPAGGVAPVPTANRTKPIQELSKSSEWHYSPEDGDAENSLKKIVRPESYHFQYQPEHNMPNKVGRSAGRMPNRAQSASSQVLRMARKQNEYFKHAPPLRTPPSIPSPLHTQQQKYQSPRYGQRFNAELEHHARKVRSPRHFMEHVVDLRKDIHSAPAGTGQLSNEMVQAALTVRSLDKINPSRESTMVDMSLQNHATTNEFEEHPSELAISEAASPSPANLQLEFSGELMADANIDNLSIKQEGGDDSEKENNPVTSPKEKKSPIQSQYTSSRTGTMASISGIGRPIAQYSQVSDPNDVANAVQLQKEAKAAVDIQRIFRGYVARNMYKEYKKLLSDERASKEDEQIAKNEAKRKYREHLQKKKDIYSRPLVSKETKEWTNNVKNIQDKKADERQKKVEERSEILAKNYQRSSTKLAVIGPHVDIYQVYHPKQTGPTKQQQTRSAIKIQGLIRGFLIRKRFEKLKRKVKWYGLSWRKLVAEYKSLLYKVQKWHGMAHPKTPFSIKEMNEYMDLRRRYECVFEKKAYAGELEVSDIESFFKECDLYPSKFEIEEAIDVVTHGQMALGKRKGLKKSEALELVFYIYVPTATGLTATRQSTWMNPIIDGEEAKKLIGSDLVEPAPFEVCAKLVIDSKRERKEKEKLQKEKENQATSKKTNVAKKVRIKEPSEI